MIPDFLQKVTFIGRYTGFRFLPSFLLLRVGLIWGLYGSLTGKNGITLSLYPPKVRHFLEKPEKITTLKHFSFQCYWRSKKHCFVFTVPTCRLLFLLMRIIFRQRRVGTIRGICWHKETEVLEVKSNTWPLLPPLISYQLKLDRNWAFATAEVPITCM
jgi:hypothetical protein